MTLRTPRRRISPRTKLRYRAIREFFRRALGSNSEQDIKINSSIAVNVTDLKRKIVGLEQQLDQVNRHCRDIVCLDDNSRQESGNFTPYYFKHDIDTIKEQTEVSSERKSINGHDSDFLYKSSEVIDKTLDDCDHNISKSNFDNKSIQMPTNDHPAGILKVNSRKLKSHNTSNSISKLHKHKTRSVYDNINAALSTSSFHSLANENSKGDADYLRYPYSRKLRNINVQPTMDKNYKEFLKKHIGDDINNSFEDKPNKYRTKKHLKRDLDPDYIADIIQKQYKPVKMFGRKASDFSQFSAPICRDQEFQIKENIIEGSELCSCFHPDMGRSHRRRKRHDLNEMRSVCDTRLYSCHKNTRQKHRRIHVDSSSNSDMYDFIPVKEKSSPETRRKFTTANMIPYDYCREVPPSPRTHRPRLNLKAQYYTELEDYIAHAKEKYRKRLPQKQHVCPVYLTKSEDDDGPELKQETNVEPHQIPQKYINIPIEVERLQTKCQQQTTGTMSSIPYSQYNNEQPNTNNVDTSLNKTQETDISVDKADKALCEIKDILQNFLHEIKKETVVSQCDKLDIQYKTQDNESSLPQDPSANNVPTNSSNVPTNNASFNKYNNLGPCGIPPYIPPFPTNPCCYPIMPVCPINCQMPLQNGGYVIPSKSFTCTSCAKTPKETMSSHCCNNSPEPACNSETDELIKEIYKFVAQGQPERKRDGNKAAEKLLTSRSTGESTKDCHYHDVKVGTQPLKCYSKSCEAIGSRIVSDTYYSGTHATYSDTVLEKLSLDADTETEPESENTESDKKKKNKFSQVLQSIGLFKKKKRNIIEEVSESESTMEGDLKAKDPVYRQHLTNYMMHGQDYYDPPPLTQFYDRQPKYHGTREYENITPRSFEYQHPRNEHQPHPHEYQSRRREHRSKRHKEYQRSHEYQPNFHSQYNPGIRGYPSPPLNDPYGHNRPQHLRTQDPPRPQSPPLRQRPTGLPYSSSYDTTYSHMQPPLCLKEVEVKSTGTQSERKMSIFGKFKKKVNKPVIMTHVAGADEQRTFSTQTAAPTKTAFKLPTKMTKPLFDWKSLQAKAKQTIPQQDLDPLMYSYQTQKQLAHGNLKMRHAMLKKLFYKKNPFSPRNLIVKTLLGKDKSSFGEASPALMRPKMFF